jgi:hypothetical protein
LKRIHALFIALALGIAAVAGTFAALETTSLGAEAATVSEAEIAARDRKLDRAEAALRRAAKRRPPRLPAPAAAAAPAAVALQPFAVTSSSHHDFDDDRGRHHGRDHDQDEWEHELEDEDRDDHHGRGRGRGRGGDEDD